MDVIKATLEERVALVIDWKRVHDFPSILFKELLNQNQGYWTGQISRLSADEFLSLQLRDQDVSKCLTPPNESHSLRDILHRMKKNDWTFASLASSELDIKQAPRRPEWFASCAKIDAGFDVNKLGDLAVHPRKGFKEQAVHESFFDPSHHEIYEGQHRALVLAAKLVERTLSFPNLEVLYLFPNRAT